jgi:signal transduction histidine kinase
MNVVKGFAQLIYDGTYGELPEQVKDTAHKIKDSADRLIVLVNNLLDIGKIEEGKLEFKFLELDIVALVRSMAEEYKIIADGRGLGINFTSSVPVIRMQADGEKLRQVFQNLIDNSIKYTEHGSVNISVKDDSDTVLVTVSDTGRGLSKELQQKLFQRFVRDEKTKNEIQGTGLGLYIAKEIVNAHHGQIWAESDGEGKGSRFNVRLSKI